MWSNTILISPRVLYIIQYFSYKVKSNLNVLLKEYTNDETIFLNDETIFLNIKEMI